MKCYLICLVLFACTAAKKGPAQQQPQATEVGASGGTVTESGGTVTVPSGAVSASTPITVTTATTAAAPAETVVVGATLVMGPEGQTFASPVTVTLAFDPTLLPAGTTSANVEIYTAPVGSTTFTSLGGTVTDSTHVQATTTHFSQFVPVVSAAIIKLLQPTTLCSNVWRGYQH